MLCFWYALLDLVICICVRHVSVGVYGGQRRASDPLVLELEVAMKCLTWVLRRTKTTSGSLEEQQVLLTSVPSPPHNFKRQLCMCCPDLRGSFFCSLQGTETQVNIKFTSAVFTFLMSSWQDAWQTAVSQVLRSLAGGSKPCGLVSPNKQKPTTRAWKDGSVSWE